ncbi:hypothetical protein [Streptomyces sp. RLB3-17]|uniref:hypothetical protein n=1 Tax=Streptomyces sp. RLB3-17 TaxID=2594455 RepID=UPI001CEDABE6|nr:hypothetical protein [Streptomyces sp. RLB3-17]
MPGKDELTRRRHEKLVDQLESLMRAALRPEYQGSYGQLILSGDAATDMDELKDVRRAAREAGRRLGWKTTTHLVGGRLFGLDEREVPEEIEQPAGDAAPSVTAPRHGLDTHPVGACRVGQRLDLHVVEVDVVGRGRLREGHSYSRIGLQVTGLDHVAEWLRMTYALRTERGLSFRPPVAWPDSMSASHSETSSK